MPQTTTGHVQLNVLSVLGGSKRYARMARLSSRGLSTWYLVLGNFVCALGFAVVPGAQGTKYQKTKN
jgi:hypothetical protein